MVSGAQLTADQFDNTDGRVGSLDVERAELAELVAGLEERGGVLGQVDLAGAS